MNLPSTRSWSSSRRSVAGDTEAHADEVMEGLGGRGVLAPPVGLVHGGQEPCAGTGQVSPDEGVQPRPA